MYISLSMLDNVDNSQLLKFLREQGCEYKEEEAGMDINYWISNMLKEGRVKLSLLNEYLLEELFFGMHRSIYIYKINGVRRLQNIDLWKTNLFNILGIYNIPFNNISETQVNRDENQKIAAVDYIENEHGEIEKLRILFVVNTGQVHASGISYTYSYIPVELDFKMKIMIIKARPRNKIIPGNKPHEFQEKIYRELISKMNISVTPFLVDHQEALYKMSKNILDELFRNIPGYNDISRLEKDINTFINKVTDNITLKNTEESNSGISILKGVMDIKYELNNMLQNLTVSDYLFNKDEDNIWETGINTIITCIRFNDSKNATASLSGENRSKHIFNSKAFMDLRNALEVVKNVKSLSIAYKKNRGSMRVKYDAELDDCLKILVLSHRNYNEEDFITIWERYNVNENRNFTSTSGVRQEQIS